MSSKNKPNKSELIGLPPSMLKHEVRSLEENPYFLWLKSQQALSKSLVKSEQQKLMPDISINYFVGTNRFENAKYYQGFEAGLAVPLFFNAQRSKIKASRFAAEASTQLADYELEQIKTKQTELLILLDKSKELVEQYAESGAKLYEEILRTSKLSFENGEIDFFRFAGSTETALQIKLDYLNNLMEYSNVALELNYLSK